MKFDIPEILIIGLSLLVIWLFAYDRVVQARKRTRAVAPNAAAAPEPALRAREHVAPLA